MGQPGQAGQMGHAGQALALTELCWLQNSFTLELLTDKPDARALDDLGKLIRKAERRALEAERRRA